MDTQPTKTNKRNLVIVSVLTLLILGIGAYLVFSRIQRSAVDSKKQLPKSELPEVGGVLPAVNEQTLGQDEVAVFFIDLENKRQLSPVIGCGDSLSFITRTYNKKGKTTEELVKTVLGFLFEPKEQYVGKGGLYNSLYQSELAVDKVTLDKGIASVFLIGTYKLGGECDSPRFEAQIKQTALQFTEVKSVLIFVNGTQLNLSLK